MKVIFISFLVILFDQTAKLFVKGFNIPFLGIQRESFNNGMTYPLIDDLFHITMVENPGIAFGLTFGPDSKTLISFFTIAASAALLVYFFIIKDKNLSLRLSIAIIIGGAFGNMIDRIFYGYFYGYAPIMEGKVVDFLDLRLFSTFLFNQSFGAYVFNFADVAITIGVLLLLFNLKNRDETVSAGLLPVSKSVVTEEE